MDGTWDGVNTFWNQDNTGAAAGPLVATTTTADDLFIGGGTAGTITLAGTQSASSFTFAHDVATVLTGGTLQLWNGGSRVGLFVESPVTAATTVNSTVDLTGGAPTIQNLGTGLLTLGGPVITGADALTVGGSGNITINGAIGAGAGNLVKTGGGTLTLGAANTYTGNTILDGGTVRYTADNTAVKVLQFGATAGSTTVSALEVNANVTATGLSVVTNNTAANTITIASGKTLTSTGGLSLGYDSAGGTGAHDSNLTISGAGAFSVTGTTVNISVNQAVTNAAYFSQATLDLTGLTGGFTANVTDFNVGVGGNSQGPGTLKLSNTTNTLIATTLRVGDTGSNNGKGQGTLTLGTGVNIIQADNIHIGRGKNSGPGFVSFASQVAGSPGTVKIRNKAGTGAGAITVGNINGVGTAGGAVGTLDLRGHVVDVLASTLLIGQNNGTSTGNVSGTVSFDAGTFTVATLTMAPKTAAGVANAAATLNVGGGTFVVNTAFTLGSQATAGTSVATLNLTGGTFTSNANIVRGAGTVTSTINLNGANAILNVTGKTIGNANPVTLNLLQGTLQNLAQYNNGAAPVTVAATGTVTLGGTNAYTGGTTLTSGTLRIAAASSLGSTSGTLTVNGGVLDVNGNDLGVGNLTGAGGTIVNNLAATNKVLTVGNGNATGGIFGGTIANNGGTGGTLALTKVGTGSIILSGANTYTGATTVGAGNLVVTGSIANTTGVSVAGGAGLYLLGGPAGSPAALTSLNLGAGGGTTVVGLGLGANTASSSTLNIAGAATTANTINFAIGGLSGFGGAGTYDLITAGSGLSAANYGLAYAPGGYTYSLSETDTKVQLSVTAAVAGTRYWRGQVGGSWSAFAGNDTNWFTDAAGTVNANSNPGAGSSIVFGTANAAGPAIATTLDNNYTVNDLQFTSAPAGVTSVSIAPGVLPTNALTIAPSASTAGISLAAGAGAVSISAPVVLGASQTWSVDSSTPGAGTASSLTVSGPISGSAANGLTFTTTSGIAPIVLAAPGTSTYAGPSTVSASTIVQGGATNAFSPNTAWTVQGTLSTGAFNQTTGSLVGGAGVVQNGSATNATLSVGADNLASATFAGTIENGSTGTLALTKVGTGEQILTGTGTYTGATTVSSGILRIAGPIASTTTAVNGAATLRLGANNVLPLTTALTLSGTGTLDLFGNSQTIASLAQTATNTITNTGTSGGPSTATTPGSPTLTDALTITAAGTSASLPVLITDGPTRKTQIVLTNANLGATFPLTNTGNTFSGGLVLAHSPTGTRLDIDTAAVTQTLGTGPVIVGQASTDKAGIFFPNAGTLNNPVIFNTALGTDRVGLRADAAVVLNGVVTANLAPAKFTSNNALGSVTLNNQVTGAEGLVLDIVSSAAASTAFGVTLNNATVNPNDYAGDTVVNFNAANNKSATLTLGAANQIPNGAGKGNVVVNTSAAGTGVGLLDLNGFNETINGLSGTGTVDGGAAGTPLNTLTLGDGNATATFAGTIRNTAGTLSLTKIGSGTQTLTGTSTFGGAVTVTGGTLALGGSSNFAGNLTVSNGATAALSGSHTFTGSINADTGGTVTFASSPVTDGPLGNSTQVNLNNGTLSYTASGPTALNRSVAIAAANPGTVNVASSTGTLSIDTVSSAGGNLVKTGPGALTLVNPTTLNGGAAGVVVNAGLLQAGFGTNGINSINVGATGRMSFQNGLAEVLTLGGPGTLTLASGARMGFELDAPGTSDRVVYNAASVAGGSNVTLSFFNLGGLGAGSYTLLSSVTPGGLTGVNFNLGTAPNGFNYTINNNGTNVTLTTIAYSPIFWRGGQDGSWNTLGAGPANWTTDAAGAIDAGHKPLATETVIFSAAGAAGPSVATTLDAPFTVDSVQFTAAPAGVTDVTVNPGAGGSLTVTPTSTSGGLRILTGGGNATIAAPVTLGAGQTWDVADDTSTLALTGGVAFNAAVNKTGPGTITLGGPGTGTGTITLTGGRLNVNAPTAIGGGTLTVNAGTTIDNTSAGAVVMSTNNPVNVTGDFSFAGTNDLRFGTGTVTLTNNPIVTTTG
ncbi:MAG: autotransporter-associated beta strand repeat-containing protein, partial [Phycisphaerae bacterium]